MIFKFTPATAPIPQPRGALFGFPLKKIENGAIVPQCDENGQVRRIVLLVPIQYVISIDHENGIFTVSDQWYSRRRKEYAI